ncbi:MAG TPA: CapA family protein [Frankiaceae bacterium]|nr:CapA family protein [Frankiaceae bacterium]
MTYPAARPLAACVAALALAACGSSPAPRATDSPSPAPTTASSTPTPSPTATPTPTPTRTPTKAAVGPVTIVFGGDVDLDRRVRQVIAAQGVDAPWRGIAPTLRAADLAFLNLECAITTRGRPENKSYTFRGDPSALRGAVNAGVDVFSLANNHTLDYGLDGFADTLEHVRVAGIKTTGAGRNLPEAMRPAVFPVNGRKVAFLGMSAIIPAPKWVAGPDRPGMLSDDDALVELAVREARRVADIVIPYFHWGIEYTYSPSAAQRRAARTAIRAGATMVVGGHTHVLQPIEVVDGRLVAWSMSNLVFQSRPESVRTQLLKVTIKPDGAVDWATEPYRIESGVPLPDRSRTPLTGRVPAP